MLEYVTAIVFMSPKKNAANSIRPGFHCPKISTASARNPYPATFESNVIEVGTTNTSPPIPASAPDIITPA